MTQHHYVIGFVSTRPGGNRYGRIDMTRTAPITSMDDLAGIERDLRNHYADPDVVVLSFSRFADPSANGGERP